MQCKKKEEERGSEGKKCHKYLLQPNEVVIGNIHSPGISSYHGIELKTGIVDRNLTTTIRYCLSRKDKAKKKRMKQNNCFSRKRVKKRANKAP